MSTLSEFATIYFNSHLDKAFWTGLSADSKTAALTMAENDIIALLDPAVDPTCDAARKAICEQAVYLARNYEQQNEGKIQTGSGVEGITENYAIIGTPGISPRAQFFINLARKQNIGGTIRIGRG